MTNLAFDSYKRVFSWAIIFSYLILGLIKRLSLSKSLYWILISFSIISILVLIELLFQMIQKREIFLKSNFAWISLQLVFFSLLGFVSYLFL